MWIVVRFKSRPRRRRNSRPGLLARSIDWCLVTLWNTVTGSKVRHLMKAGAALFEETIDD